MQQILLSTVYAALFAAWLFELPLWQHLTRTGPLQRKPFTCLYCFTFWLSITIGLILFALQRPGQAVAFFIAAPAASILATLISKLLNSLPTTL